VIVLCWFGIAEFIDVASAKLYKIPGVIAENIIPANALAKFVICALLRLAVRCSESESESEDWRRLFTNSTR
jgi:hypothetical protein